MEEIEVKILDIDKDDVINRLLKLGAKKTFEGTMTSIYLDSNHRLGNEDKNLRIRQKGDRCILTSKSKKEDSEAKVREEYETEVKDFKETMAIFRNIGFTECENEVKERISYKIKNSSVEIDSIEGTPPFLEVESPNKDELKEVVKMLGFSFEQAKTWTSKKVVDFYKKHS